MNPYAQQSQAYKESAILTASPEQLVVMLYDGAARFLRQAEAALQEQAWLHAGERITRGEAIIDELIATLNMDAGEISERLQGIYVFCKRCLIEARIQRDPAQVGHVIRLLGELREAWAQVASGPAGVPAPGTAPRAAAPRPVSPGIRA
ncbi:Flagellar secretion chaperone FliS [Paraconexibacter sp. AEG42_29]|uniref:Flagellar secretion chaperone FliS n=1 Tax=Paraconexibacter sp. AEG42_29 TaxID=2997339 RepID=A0AAU7ANS2_9ACTN